MANKPPRGKVIECHGVTLGLARHSLTVDGQAIHLTPTEFRILDTLMREPGRLFDRETLRDIAMSALVNLRTIDAHIHELRRKLGDKSGLIESVYGQGYRFLPVPKKRKR